MNVDKAIELLKVASQGWPFGNNEDYYKALDMGRAALMRVKSQRRPQSHINLFHSILEKLPGED